VTAGVIALLAALALAVIAGAGWKLTNGRMRTIRLDDKQPGADQPASASPPVSLSAGQLGQPLGERATLLQFSSAFCAPCRATRRILADVAGMTSGVAHIEIDAESRLDLVRQFNVLRTPTVLVLAANGSIVRRASGQPRKPDVIAAIGEATSNAIPTYMIGIEDSDSSSQHA
jgi:thiol-disulfide isomerase/thioredoxin